MDIQTKLTEITPELARKMLERISTVQRPENWNLVCRYAQTMKRGDWRITHQGILLTDDGELLDGQHRLKAVVQSGCSITTPVSRVSNASASELKSLFDATDFGKPRSLGFTLQSVHGIRNGMRTAAAIASIGCICARFRPSIMSDQAVDIYRIFKVEIETMNDLIGAHRSMQKGHIVGSLAFALKTGDPKATEFCHQVITGENISRNTPAYTLRQAILDFTKKTKTGTYIPNIILWCAGCLMAHLQGRSMSTVKSAYGPLDEMCELLPKEVASVRSILGNPPSNLKRIRKKE